MPHVDIKCFPRELTDEQKTALAADITEVLIRHLNSKESAVSVALTQVERTRGRPCGTVRSPRRWRS